MPSHREWPRHDTEALLNFVDEHGASLSTPGPKRREGLTELTRHVNKVRISGKLPAYSVDDIRERCNFLTQNYGCVVGPKVTDFFRHGRNYLQAPFGNNPSALPEEPEDLSSNIRVSPVSSTLINDPHYQLDDANFQPRPRKRNRIDGPKERRRKASQISQNIEEGQPLRQKSTPLSLEGVPVSLEGWHELFYLRSRNDRIQFQEIEPGMFQLERNAYKAVDACCNGSGKRLQY